MPNLRFAPVAWSLLLAGCVTSSAVTGAAPGASATPPPTAGQPAASPIPASAGNTIEVWMPPSLAVVDSPAADDLLAAQIVQFKESHPDVDVRVLFKRAAGRGGLLDSLTTAYNVAPSILPNLIALSRTDLAAAAAVGLVVPLDGLIPPQTLDDYYPFAQAMSRVEGALVGLPFAADARVMAYNTEAYPTAPLTWSEVTTGPLLVPGAEATSLALVSQYLALGGALADASGRVALDPNLLAEVLTFFQGLQTSGVLPLSSLTYSDTAATWQVFRERRAALAVTSAQWYLAERERIAAGAAALLPTRDGKPLALADGWSWAIVNTAPARQPLTAELMLWLTDPAQLAPWTLAARVLPPRASALAGWGDSPLAPFASNVLIHAQLQPSAEILAVVGPPLRQALDDVLNGRADPLTAATQAAQSVASH